MVSFSLKWDPACWKKNKVSPNTSMTYNCKNTFHTWTDTAPVLPGMYACVHSSSLPAKEHYSWRVQTPFFTKALKPRKSNGWLSMAGVCTCMRGVPRLLLPQSMLVLVKIAHVFQAFQVK